MANHNLQRMVSVIGLANRFHKYRTILSFRTKACCISIWFIFSLSFFFFSFCSIEYFDWQFQNWIEMSATTCNVRGKQSDGILQKVGPMKATIPMSSLLRPLNNVTTNTCHFSITMSPPMQLLSPDHNGSGHRSPGSINYSKGKSYLLDSATLNSCIRRTVSLDALVSLKSSDAIHKPVRSK